MTTLKITGKHAHTHTHTDSEVDEILAFKLDGIELNPNRITPTLLKKWTSHDLDDDSEDDSCNEEKFTVESSKHGDSRSSKNRSGKQIKWEQRAKLMQKRQAKNGLVVTAEPAEPKVLSLIDSEDDEEEDFDARRKREEDESTRRKRKDKDRPKKHHVPRNNGNAYHKPGSKSASKLAADVDNDE